MPPHLVIGRRGAIDEIERRLREGLSTMLVGPRRIGKTTVCDAVCDRLRADGVPVIEVEVPERRDAAALLQAIVHEVHEASLLPAGRRLVRAARPLAEKLLEEHGIPLDLSELGAESGELPMREIVALPAGLAERSGRPVVFFLDELQRAVDYENGAQLLTDLTDLYGGASDVVVLVDGSDERALDGMLGAPIHFGKLCDRQPLAPKILPLDTWREPLRARFRQARLEIDSDALQRLLDFGAGRPYETMLAARYAALSARKLAEGEELAPVADFEARMGIDEAVRHLRDDGA